MNISKTDRLILINQYKILEVLYPNEGKIYKNHRIALENGYTLNYDWLFDELDSELSEDICKEIFSILTMYRAIYNSYNKLPNKDNITSPMLKFIGVDGNEEYKEFAYINYIVYDLNRFDELKYGNKFADFNSHQKMLPRYRNMLHFWQENSSPQEMDEKLLNSLLRHGEK